MELANVKHNSTDDLYKVKTNIILKQRVHLTEVILLLHYFNISTL